MLAFLTRNRRQDTQPMNTETETITPQVPAPAMRFLTQGRAEVHVTQNGTFERGGFSHNFKYGVLRHHWKCLGCGEHSDYYKRLDESEARGEANNHADTCRAMPRPTA